MVDWIDGSAIDIMFVRTKFFISEIRSNNEMALRIFADKKIRFSYVYL